MKMQTPFGLIEGTPEEIAALLAAKSPPIVHEAPLPVRKDDVPLLPLANHPDVEKCEQFIISNPNKRITVRDLAKGTERSEQHIRNITPEIINRARVKVINKGTRSRRYYLYWHGEKPHLKIKSNGPTAEARAKSIEIKRAKALMRQNHSLSYEQARARVQESRPEQKGGFIDKSVFPAFSWLPDGQESIFISAIKNCISLKGKLTYDQDGKMMSMTYGEWLKLMDEFFVHSQRVAMYFGVRNLFNRKMLDGKIIIAYGA